jgi:hypothetical protein
MRIWSELQHPPYPLNSTVNEPLSLIHTAAHALNVSLKS